jgi:hypothetical protein
LKKTGTFGSPFEILALAWGKRAESMDVHRTLSTQKQPKFTSQIASLRTMNLQFHSRLPTSRKMAHGGSSLICRKLTPSYFRRMYNFAFAIFELICGDTENLVEHITAAPPRQRTIEVDV